MKLLITEPIDFSEKALKLLKNNFIVETLDHVDQLSKTIFDVEVLFVRLGIVLDSGLLSKAYNLKLICTPTTGLDHIDVKYCMENNIKILSLKGEYNFLGSIPSTAEHTWTLLTAVNRKLFLASTSVHQKIWDRNKFKSFDLDQKKLGILGLGRVGKQVAKYAQCFGMQVYAYDTDISKIFEGVVILDSPEKLFKISDFISIHIPFEDSNFEFVSKSYIALMNPLACIINTSRGKIWDEKAIVEALVNNNIRGVATDVVYNEFSENTFDSPILKLDLIQHNCIITPHIAGATYDSMKQTEIFIANKLLAHA
jgi:D-3-phosphoglycerate dehydrogenase